MHDTSNAGPRGFLGRTLPFGWKQSSNYGEVGAPRFVQPVPPAARPAGEARLVRDHELAVATYNVELVKRPGAVLDLLRREPRLGAVDVLALQEADETLVLRAAEQLDMAFVYYPSMRHPLTGLNFGPAILSRWPVLDHARVALPGRGWTRGTRRIAVRATLQVRAQRIRCYSVHLSTMWEMSPSSQDAQARAVVVDALASPDPVLVAGDLNRMGAGRVFANGGFRWITRRVGRTHHIWSFDHVFVRGLDLDGAATGSVREALSTSDHRAVWATLALRETGTTAVTG
jgi:endonuclease/exonuclease/phosphatase family metal-dependent hydrolase